MMTPLNKWLLGTLTCLLMSTNSLTRADECDLAPLPYTANYSVSAKGKIAGSMQVVLELSDDGTFYYRMDTNAKRGLVRPRIQQNSRFSWENGRVMPASFRSTVKVAFFKRKESVDFNWESMIATGFFRLMQWDDEVVPRETALALFGDLGSKDKALHAHPGPHVAVPPAEMRGVADYLAARLDA